MAYTNVGFKYGTQAKLNALISAQGAEPGCFYLTSDTQRLYVGKEVLDDEGQPQIHSDGAYSGKIKAIPVSVNAGIQFVNSIDDLPRYGEDNEKDSHAGEFYYIPTDNILCVYSGQQFVQINNNTNTYLIDEQDNFVLRDDDSNHTTELVLSLLQGDAAGGIPIEDVITIKGDQGVQISSTSTNAEVQEGDTSFHKKIKELTITGDQYDISFDGLAGKQADSSLSDIKIKLDSKNSDHSSDVTLFPGKNVTFSTHGDENGLNGISIQAEDTTIDSISVRPMVDPETQENDNGFVISIVDNNNIPTEGTFDPTISYMNNVAGTDKPQVHFINGNLDLPVYSSEALSEFEKALNAMTYKGTVGTTGGYATGLIYDYKTEDAENAEANDEYYAGTWRFVKDEAFLENPKIGDVFLVVGDNFTIPEASDLSIGARTCTPGTLLIAHILNYDSSITEDANGRIPDGYLDFDIVESTSDTDTQYKIVQNAQQKVLTLQNTVTNVPVNSVKFNGTNKINIDAAQNSTDTSLFELTFKHDKLASGEGKATAEDDGTQSYLTDYSITAVTGLTLDEYGHVTGFSTKKHTVKDSNATLESLSNSASAANNVGTITTSAVFKDANNMQKDVTAGSFTLNSQTLSISETAENSNGLTINLSWGTF